MQSLPCISGGRWISEKFKEATIARTLEERDKYHVSQSTGAVPKSCAAIPDSIRDKVAAKLHPQLSRKKNKHRVFDNVKRYIPNTMGNSVVPSNVTCIWDYAGQVIYYITHRFYLTGGSSYCVVFSLLDKLDDLALPRDLQKGSLNMTNLQMNIFWIRSIYEHAVLRHNGKSQWINEKIASPTICLVATHKDKLKGREEEKQREIEAKFKRIFDEIEGTEYECHVDREMYVVDNTLVKDKGIQRLKKNLGGYTKLMVKAVPTKWVDFQYKIQELGKTTFRMTLDEIAKIAADCGISNSMLITVLDYLSDIGVILYSKTNDKLKNTVITNLNRMIDILTKIITVVKPGDIDKWPKLMPFWHKLDNEGILHEELLRHLWRRELKIDAENFDIFLEVIKLFGLLFEKQMGAEQGNRMFIVPSRMQINKESLKVKKDEKQTVSIYVTPTDFLHDAVYHTLVIAFLDLMIVKGRSEDQVELFANRSDFHLDDVHLVSLGTVKIKNRHALKLEISHKIEVNINGEHVISEPHPSVCMEVLSYLRHQLGTVYGTKEGIGYKLRVLCSICQAMQPHLHDLEDCLNKDKVSCGKMSMNTIRFKELFSKKFVDYLIIELGTKRMKEFFLKTTQQTSSSVVEFLKKEKENGSFASLADFQGQHDIFLPDSDVNNFDIEILMTLIRCCCRFTYPDDIWEQPDKINNPELANLIRIQQYKNTKIDRNTICRIPAKDFNDEWKEFREICSDLDVHIRKGFDETAIHEMQNFQTIMLLVVGLGTDVMRKYFLRVHKLSEGNVGHFLMSMKSSFTKEARLFKEQKNKMFTPKANIYAFDISIMIKIIRYCHCGHPLPDSFWSQPDETLDSELANLVNIHQYRNTKLAHTASPRMSTKEFDAEWKKLTSIFLGLGVSVEDIDQYQQLRLSI